MENGTAHRNHNHRPMPMETRGKHERISDHEPESPRSYRPTSRRRYEVNRARTPEEERMSEPSDREYQSNEDLPMLTGIMWKAGLVLCFVLAVAALIIGIVAYSAAGNLQETTNLLQLSIDDLESPSPLELSYPTSCQNLDRGLGSGLYLIRPNPSMLAFPAYCDMTTNGGGWTLVASVHENDIDGKCTTGDKWSSEDGRNPGIERGSLNWENLRSFGRVEDVTSGDYKNPAYFAVEASNVMIWHVPNGSPISQIENQAFWKYYTNDDFLESNGGTLRDLFKEHAFIRAQENSGLFPLVREFNATTRSILDEVPNWHRYIYDGANQITDGGMDAYDDGNIVSYRINRRDNQHNFTQITYNAPYTFINEGVEILSSTTYPFVVLAWVKAGNAARTSSFEFRVDSEFGADGNGNVEFYDLTDVTFGSMQARYIAYNLYGARNDASICEVFFYLGSTELWNSVFPERIDRVGWTTSTHDARNIARFTGQMSNVLLGYALLSRVSAGRVDPQHIANVLTRYMRLAETFVFRERVNSFSVPVEYDRGNNLEIHQRLPTSDELVVNAGFIQFRAINTESIANALCPGVRIRSGNSDRVCIGGGNSAAINLNVCGDFAGWAGRPGDRGNATNPSKTGRSLEDINSSILIFTR